MFTLRLQIPPKYLQISETKRKGRVKTMENNVIDRMENTASLNIITSDKI